MALGISGAEALIDMRKFAIVLGVGLVFLNVACSREAPPMSEEWCEAMMVKANKEWTEHEAKLFARDCLHGK